MCLQLPTKFQTAIENPLSNTTFKNNEDESDFAALMAGDMTILQKNTKLHPKKRDVEKDNVGNRRFGRG